MSNPNKDQIIHSIKKETHDITDENLRKLTNERMNALVKKDIEEIRQLIDVYSVLSEDLEIKKIVSNLKYLISVCYKKINKKTS